MVYKYETHLHTFPVSKCAKADVRENLEFYKKQGYDGVFITNHFLDGNINIESIIPYEDRIDFYFSDYENALLIAKEIKINVFCGVEISYKGTDFLVYGLDKEWFKCNSQIMNMNIKEKLIYFIENEALVIQAHPFREADYIDQIRLFPNCIHGVEIENACRTEKENKMAKIYAENYGLIEFAGTDNHIGKKAKKLAGLCLDKPILNEYDFIERVKNEEMKTFIKII